MSASTPTLRKKTNPTVTRWKIVLRLPSDYVAEDNIVENKAGFFAILDGHGGADVSEYCSKYLPEVAFEKHRYSRRSTRSSNPALKLCLRLSAKEWTRRWSPLTRPTGGPLAALFWWRGEGPKDIAVLAIWGIPEPSSALTSRSQRGSPSITRSTTPARSTESSILISTERSEGGTIIKGRVAGTLAITRALGDLDIKPYV